MQKKNFKILKYAKNIFTKKFLHKKNFTIFKFIKNIFTQKKFLQNYFYKKIFTQKKILQFLNL
jgi:hypothetical protein